jgi:hypothetical protein
MTNSPIRIKSPTDILAVVPFVLGFHPEDSMVVLTADQAARQLHARVDLPGDDEGLRLVVEQLAAAIAHSRGTSVVLVAYTDDQCLALEAVGRLGSRLEEHGVEVQAAIRADGERWFSLDGCDDSCCPVDGTPYDVSAHPVTAQGVLDGRVTFRSRQELADSLVTGDPDAVDAVAESADDAMRRFTAATRKPLGQPDPERARRHLVAEGTWLRGRVARYLETGEPLDHAEAGRAVVAMVSIDVRDVAWAAITRGTARQHVELWRDVVRRAPLDLVAAPAALLAFAAWLAGDGALAWCAVERCQEAEPDYSLAGLISQALAGAVHPETWDGATIGTPTLFAG